MQINELGLEGRREFIARFFEAIVGAPKDLWHPALIVLDETHRYAPQDGKEASSAAVAALASEGRKRGFTAIYATQRMAKIDKDALGDINNWLLGRVGQSRDRQAVADEIGIGAKSKEALELARFPAGRFYAMGPALSPAPVLVHIGNVTTTHIKSGQRGVPVPPAPDEIRGMMASLNVKEPEKGESAEKSTGSGIVNLPGERTVILPARADKQALAEEYRRGEGEGYARGKIEGYRDGIKEFETLMPALRTAVHAASQMEDFATSVENWLSHHRPENSGEKPAIPGEYRQEVAEIGQAPARAPRQKAENGAVPQPHQRILDALAWLDAAGFGYGAAKAQVAWLARYSASSSSFDTYLSRMRSGGLIEYPEPDKVAMTPAGRTLARRPEKPLRSRDLHDALRDRLPSPLWKIVEQMIKHGKMTREELAAATNYSASSSSFDTYLSRTKSLGLIHYPERGSVAPEKVLFLQ